MSGSGRSYDDFLDEFVSAVANPEAPVDVRVEAAETLAVERPRQRGRARVIAALAAALAGADDERLAAAACETLLRFKGTEVVIALAGGVGRWPAIVGPMLAERAERQAWELCRDYLAGHTPPVVRAEIGAVFRWQAHETGRVPEVYRRWIETLPRADARRVQHEFEAGLARRAADRGPVPPGLAELLEAVPEPLREQAAEILVDLHRPDGVARLLMKLCQEEGPAWIAIVRAFAALPPERGLAAIVAVLHGDEPRHRKAAAQVLGILGDPRAVASLADALTHTSASRPLRREALHALIAIGAQSSATVLMHWLRRGPMPDRLLVLRYAGEAELIEALADLEVYLQHPDAAFRRAAVASLAALQGVEALPALRVLSVRDPVKPVADAAERAVGALSDYLANLGLVCLDDGAIVPF